MSEIRDLHEQIEKIQKVLIKKRLEHLDTIKGSDDVLDMDDSRMFDSDDFGILMEIAEQEGLSEGSGFIKYNQEFDYNEFADNVIMKINGQLYEFTLESSNMFYASALTGKASRNTADLVDIDLDELLQIDSQTLQDKSISELCDELKEKRKDFMTLKLSSGIKEIQDGIEPSSESELTVFHEIELLDDMFRKAGCKSGTDYVSKWHHTKWKNMTDRNKRTIYLRVGDNIIKYDEMVGRLSKETTIQDLEEYFKDDDIDRVIEEERATGNQLMTETIRSFSDEPEKSQLIALTPIDLEQLGISIGDTENQRSGNAVITMEQIKGLTANVPEEEVEKTSVDIQKQMRNWRENQKDESTRDEQW